MNLRGRTGTACLACIAATLAGGCGGSGKAAGASGSSTRTTAPPSQTNSSGSSLKVDGTPKFASPSPSAPVLSGLVQIAYRGITIHPDTLRVKVGSTIRWTNYDPLEYNVHSEGGPQQIASKDFGEGQSFEVKVTRRGVIHYVCTNHPVTMNGTIEVLS